MGRNLLPWCTGVGIRGFLLGHEKDKTQALAGLQGAWGHLGVWGDLGMSA